MVEFIAITGATGNIGKAAAELLLSQGKKVRAIGRSPDKLKSLAAKGAELFLGSLDDAESMTKAFTGASAVFAMIPPNHGAADLRGYQNKVGDALAEAIRRAAVKRVVFLSSIGAQLDSGTGPVLGLHDFEEKLRALGGIDAVLLRPTYFMENHFFSLGLIKGQGINGGAMRPDVPVPMIATRDIAAEAARLLAGARFSGVVPRDLLGPRDYTMEEATRILGAAIGKPDLKYVQFPYEDALKGMVAAGLSPDVAAKFVEMNRGFNEGRIRPERPRSPASTTPTTLEQFAAAFAAAYNG